MILPKVIWKSLKGFKLAIDIDFLFEIFFGSRIDERILDVKNKSGLVWRYSDRNKTVTDWKQRLVTLRFLPWVIDGKIIRIGNN